MAHDVQIETKFVLNTNNSGTIVSGQLYLTVEQQTGDAFQFINDITTELYRHDFTSGKAEH